MQNPFSFPSTRNVIAGVGSALVDILLLESEEFLVQSGAAKGGMTLVDIAVILKTLSKTAVKPVIVSGGSACNTIVGIGNLGAKARFIGMRGTDEFGKLFEKDLIENHVEPLLFSTTTPTGRVLSIVTPDAQRSMYTFLGASSETKPESITVEQLSDVAIIHLEGYLLFNDALILGALKAAKKAGALVSLDLASYTVVEAKRDTLKTLIRDYVDIVIANEDEARAYTGLSDEQKALDVFASEAKLAVVKLGKRGSLIGCGKERITIERQGNGSALDTTGAGDLWAAGFLYGIAQGFNLEKAGRLASACGYEVCQVMGAHIPAEGWTRIRSTL